MNAADFNCSMGMEIYFRMPPYDIPQVLEVQQINKLSAPESTAMCGIAECSHLLGV